MHGCCRIGASKVIFDIFSCYCIIIAVIPLVQITLSFLFVLSSWPCFHSQYCFLYLGHLAVLGLKPINKYFKREDGLEIGILEQIHMKWLPSQSCNIKCYARLKFMNSKPTLSSSVLLALPMLQVNLHPWHNTSKQLAPGPRPDVSAQGMYLLKIGYWGTMTK